MIIVRTERFSSSVEAAVAHVLSYSSDYFARKLQRSLSRSIDLLATFPELGRIYDSRGRFVIRRLSVPSTRYSIFYTTNGQKIFLLKFVHGSEVVK